MIGSDTPPPAPRFGSPAAWQVARLLEVAAYRLRGKNVPEPTERLIKALAEARAILERKS